MTTFGDESACVIRLRPNLRGSRVGPLSSTILFCDRSRDTHCIASPNSGGHPDISPLLYLTLLFHNFFLFFRGFFLRYVRALRSPSQCHMLVLLAAASRISTMYYNTVKGSTSRQTPTADSTTCKPAAFFIDEAERPLPIISWLCWIG